MIADIVIFLLKSTVIQVILFALYWLLFRQWTHHGLNRLYLMGSLVISLVIPLLNNPFPEPDKKIPALTAVEWMSEPIGTFIPVETIESSTQSQSSYWPWLAVVYLVIMTFFVGRFVLHLTLLKKIKKRSEYVKGYPFNLFKTTLTRPFSFLKNVFIPVPIFGTHSFDQILAHERVHVEQLHSLDRLLVDFLVSVFWFNPFIYLYRNALIEVHEFQADQAVVHAYSDRIGYQEILFGQLQQTGFSGLVSHFNFLTIKKRIVMMNKSKNTNWSKLGYGLAFPLLAILFVGFTSKKGEESMHSLAGKIEQAIGPFETQTFEFPTFDQEDEIPSILPVKINSKFRVSSGYGTRVDPITKVRKQHRGIDLSLKTGTEIIATADGEVSLAVSWKTGYGKHIRVQHGENYETMYAHLSEIKVKKGEKVKKGQVIGLSGNSGMSTAPHLHYEVRKNEKPVDPVKYIDNYQFTTTYKNVKGAIKVDDNGNVEEEIEYESEEWSTSEVQPDSIKEERPDLDESKTLKMRKVPKPENGEELVQQIVIRNNENPSKEPLYIIDGIPMTLEYLNQLNPDDIQSIYVIKAEEAMAQYGEKASDGAVLISTVQAQITPQKVEPDTAVMMAKKFFIMQDQDKEDRPLILINGEPQDFQDEKIKIRLKNRKAKMVQLEPEEAVKKYGPKAKHGAVEIITEQ